MSIEISFPGGVAVDATYRGHVIHTDQPEPMGRNSAPAPFDLFLASLATCMGFYALRFCQERDLPTGGLGLTLTPVRDPESKRIATIRVMVRTPEGFPEKYEKAIHRAIDHCAVKRMMVEPPAFEIDIAAPVAG
ncbi:MAG TPA: OsmC family protein [Thermoanaerobaculia bacterium]|nr:OsmC family protein [Thermoanaerobaculia bacterium]